MRTFLIVFLLIAPPALALDQPGFGPLLTEIETPIPRVRAIHTTDPTKAGGSAYLLRTDPWLGYVRGRELFRREFTERDGVFGQTHGVPQPILEDGMTPMIRGAKAGSCVLCHNTPFGDGGAGPTIEKNGFTGRNTPHLFGAGLIEMLGWEIRSRLLKLGDVNQNGFIDKNESQQIEALVATTPDENASRVSFGFFGDRNGDGVPDLNPVCYIWYVDATGKRLPRATRLLDAGVAGYSFEVQVFGWGHAARGRRTPISSTLRGFSAAAFHVHAGMQAFDPTLNTELERNGLCGISLNGAQQFFTGKTLDRGLQSDTNGWSSDDPDRDGIPEELTEGDMDLLEFYLLNHPAPADLQRNPQRERGRTLLDAVGCTKCHIADWELAADRRTFVLQTQFNALEDRLEGRIQNPSGKRASVRGIFSDFAYHNVGEQFHQVQFNGTKITQFKTPPLWGVGSTAPYGHDGASLTLDSVIRRHGGEAENSIEKYRTLSAPDRASVLAFLNGLVLYAVDGLPCNMNGDGAIEAGEQFAPLREMLNKDYGVNLEYLRDTDHNGVPDIRDK